MLVPRVLHSEAALLVPLARPAWFFGLRRRWIVRRTGIIVSEEILVVWMGIVDTFKVAHRVYLLVFFLLMGRLLLLMEDHKKNEKLN